MTRFPELAVAAAAIAAVLGGCIHVELPDVTVIRGETPTDLSWKRAVELALGRHPDILRARSQLDSSARARKIALGAYLPSVDGELTRGRLKRSAGEQKTRGSAWKDDMMIGLAARQPLFTGFRTTGEYLKAKMEWGAAELAYQETSANVRSRLRSSFIELLRLRKILEVNERIAGRRHENAELIRLRYEAGRENRGALMRAEAIDEEAKFDVRKTRRQIESQAWRMSREVGGPFILSIRADGDLDEMVPEPPETPPDYPSLAGQAPAVRRLVKLAEAAKAAIILAQSEVWPKIDGTFRYAYGGEGPTDLQDDQLRLGLSVAMPFFRGGRNVLGIVRAKDDYDAALEEARSIRDGRIADLASGWTTFRDARERVVVRRAFLEADRERAEIVRAKYASGLVDFQEFDISEQDLSDSERDYVGSLADVLNQEANWESLKGATLEDVLNAR